ncbi:hypothetical protein [Streptomonospora salina]|uniref:Uncharacterized protein n=1 Tax=Streptomonospora salina TaxID=104205 RepID=A0A841E6I0_9ACTN|nr:hypothetical protein [Streptomonospora salina]MBB5998765.1 hypothetical protein [Streptomonospora salina]
MGAAPMSSTVFTQINTEWSRMVADPRIERTVSAWADADARLQQAHGLSQIEEFSRRTIDERTDALFRAILDIANGGSDDGELAGRIILQLMLGRVVVNATALRGWVGDPDEQAQAAVAAMWQTIRETPADRDRYITPYLAWTSHKKGKELAQSGAREIPVADVGDHESLSGQQPPLNPSEELLKLVSWSVAEKILSAPEAELLLERYGAPSPGRATWVSVGDPEPIAQRRGISPEAMRQRCSRTARKLSQAAARYIATNTF